MFDFPASLGRRPVTFAQLKRHTNIYRKLKPCRKIIDQYLKLCFIMISISVDASLQFFEDRSSRRQRQQIDDCENNQQAPL